MQISVVMSEHSNLAYVSLIDGQCVQLHTHDKYHFSYVYLLHKFSTLFMHAFINQIPDPNPILTY